MHVTLDPDTVSNVENLVAQRGLRDASRVANVSIATLRRAIAGRRVNVHTAAALRRVPPRVRKASDFARVARIAPPRPRETAGSWTLAAIRAAIDAQMRGQFALPVRLSEAMGRDDAIFNARANRNAPVSAVATKLDPHDSARGRVIAARASVSVQVDRTVLADIAHTLVDHAIAIGYVEQEPNESGTRIDFRLTEWPLEHVRYNASREALETTTDDGEIVAITHGDGRWIIFRRGARLPWRRGACILPGGFVWAGHADGVADWQSSSRAHGLAKFLGEMPEGSGLNDDEDEDEVALAFAQAMNDLAEGERSVAIKPFGAKVDMLANMSSAWQVFSENVVSREKAAARIYLGTDAILGSVGGAPGIDIAALFKMASTKFQSDFEALEAGLLSGMYEPWTAINYGDTRYTPAFHFLVPDPDRDAKRAEIAANLERLTTTIKSMREQKLDVTQAVINTLAAELGIEPAPQLASIDQQTSTLTLAPTDLATVVRVREARASQGLPPFGDLRDDMTLSQHNEWARAQANANAATVPTE